MVPETLDDLRARLELLRTQGVAEHDPSTGRVVFFVPRSVAPALTREEVANLAAKREESAGEAEERRRFGASGGLRPGQVSLSEIELRREEEAAQARRNQRQNEKVRAARAELDAKRGAA